MTHNATINITGNTNMSARIQAELQEVENELSRAFARYSVPHSWILNTAELLQRYEALSGKKYKPKSQEDTIV